VVIGFVDTSIFVDVLRNHRPGIEWLKAQTSPGLITPTTWMEVTGGALNKAAQTDALRLLNRFEMVYQTREDVDWAMEKLMTFRLSHNVLMNDCLIAAPAARLRLPLYTHNLKHFTPLLGELAQRPY